MTKGVMEPRSVECAVCASTFVTTHSRAKYCSDKCGREGARASWRKYGRSNKPLRSKNSKASYERNRPTVLERSKAYQSSERGKQVSAKKDERQREKFPEKYAARQAVLIAMRKGELVRQACQNCGNTNSEAHHPDYSKPLAVIWLCRDCHRAEHATGRQSR